MTYSPPGNDDPLGAAARIKRDMFLMEQKLASQVAYARECGASWAMVGKALGMTKQGAMYRFAEGKPRRTTQDPLLPLFSSPEA